MKSAKENHKYHQRNEIQKETFDDKILMIENNTLECDKQSRSYHRLIYTI